jgi:hypothetical protein
MDTEQKRLIRAFPGVVIVATALLCPCMYSDLTIKMSTSSLNPHLTGGGGREIVLVTPFTDQRQVRERCGMKKHNLNYETASAFCSVDPAKWLADSFGAELRATGFSVLMSAQGTTPFLVVAAEPAFIEGDIAVKESLPESGTIDASGRFAGKRTYYDSLAVLPGLSRQQGRP